MQVKRVEADVHLLGIVKRQVLIRKRGDVMDVQDREEANVQLRFLSLPELLGNINVFQVLINVIRRQLVCIGCHGVSL